MRVYAEDTQETLRAHDLLAQWNKDGLLQKEQHERLEQDTASGLRTTNIFLRLVLLFFTIIAVAAAIGLFFVIVKPGDSGSTAGGFFLFFAILSYIAAEVAVSQARLYRYGIEEALAICSVALACLGLGCIVSSGGGGHSEQGMLATVSVVGAMLSLWLWHRFGLWYTFAAAMIFALFPPMYWTSSHAAQRTVVCALYAVGLVCIAAIRSRHRFDCLEQGYSLAEAFLWLGIYLTLNLKLSAISEPSDWWTNAPTSSDFSASFYWTTWVLAWCLPPLILTRGVRLRDRFVIAAGILTTLLTLASNKPYLGWQRHTWDPMLLGIVLVVVATWLRRWLAQGPDGARHGFTAANMSAKHKHAFGVASSVFGLLTPHDITPAPQPQSPKFDSGFGGGSDGAGASGDF
jgi:membrane protein YdbS with pleckstrin-like domain